MVNKIRVGAAAILAAPGEVGMSALARLAKTRTGAVPDRALEWADGSTSKMP